MIIMEVQKQRWGGIRKYCFSSPSLDKEGCISCEQEKRKEKV